MVKTNKTQERTNTTNGKKARYEKEMIQLMVKIVRHQTRERINPTDIETEKKENTKELT